MASHNGECSDASQCPRTALSRQDVVPRVILQKEQDFQEVPQDTDIRNELIAEKRARHNKKVNQTLEAIIREDEWEKDIASRYTNWVRVGIKVRVCNDSGGTEGEEIATIRNIQFIDGSVTVEKDAQTQMVAKISNLKTYVPSIGSRVLILNGTHNGATAILVGKDENLGRATVTITQGLYQRVQLSIRYEDITAI